MFHNLSIEPKYKILSVDRYIYLFISNYYYRKNWKNAKKPTKATYYFDIKYKRGRNSFGLMKERLENNRT